MNIIFVMDWFNNCFLLLFFLFLLWTPAILFSRLDVATTPTWGFLSSTPTLTDRSLWRQSLTTRSTRRQAWVSSIFETLAPSPSIPLFSALKRQFTHSVCFTVTRKLVNTKFRYEKVHERHFCSPHPDSSSSFCTEGGADVNTNRWCPAPFGNETRGWILFSPPLTSLLPNVRGQEGDESLSFETGCTGVAAGGQRWRTNRFRGRKGGEKGKEQGTGCRMRKVDWEAWNTLSIFVGQLMSEKSEFSLFRIVNVVILNSEPRFIHICGPKSDVAALRALFDIPYICFHCWLQMHSWHYPFHLKPHKVANAYSESFILKLGLGNLLHLILGYSSN